MKTALLLATLLVALPLVALAPTATAMNACTNAKDAGCPGVACYGYDYATRQWDVCVFPTIYCVREPCTPYPWPPVLP